MDGFPILTAIVFTPALGALLLLFVPGGSHRAIRWMALAIAILTFAFSVA